MAFFTAPRDKICCENCFHCDKTEGTLFDDCYCRKLNSSVKNLDACVDFKVKDEFWKDSSCRIRD